MRKKYFLLVFTLLIAGGFFLKNIAVSSFFEWYLKGYANACLNAEFTYEGVHHENGRYVFDHPFITSRVPLEKGGFHFHADELIIDASISWLKRTVELGIAIQKPSLDIGKGAEEFKRIIAAPTKEFAFFYVHTHLDVPEGCLHLHDHFFPSCSPVYFSMAFSSKISREGEALFWTGEKGEGGSNMQMSFSEPEIGLLVCDVDVQALQGQSAFSFIKTLWPQWQGYQVSQGTISGNIKLSIPENEPVYAEGQVVVNDLFVSHSEPSLELNIPAMTFDLVKNLKREDDATPIQSLIYTSIAPGAALVQRKDNSTLWTLKIGPGNIDIDLAGRTEIAIEADFIDAIEKRHLIFSGGSNDHGDQRSLSVGLDLGNPAGDASKSHSIQFSTRFSGDKWDFGEVEVQGLGTHEFSFLQHFMRYYYPDLHPLELHKGSVDAAIFIHFDGWNISHIALKRFSLRDVEFTSGALGISGGVKEASGHMEFDPFVSVPVNSSIETLQADIHLLSGWLDTEIDQTKWKFSDIHSNIAIRHGAFKHSTVNGTAAGLKGQIVLDGSVLGPQMALELKGKLAGMANLFPEPIRPLVNEQFHRDHIKISATLMKYAGSIICKGGAHIYHAGMHTEELFFGFSLDKLNEDGWKKPLYPIGSNLEFLLPKSSEISFNHFISSISIPAEKAYQNILQQSLMKTGFTLRNGWFKGNHLSLERYIAPFFFPKNQLKLSGLGDFKATFDEQAIAVHYDIYHLTVENNDFSFEVKNFNQGSFVVPKLKRMASHRFDLKKRIDFGIIPVHNGVFFEKKSGLLFTDVNAQLHLEDGKLHATKLDTFCNGVYFAGDLKIDWSMPGEGVFTTDVHLGKANGTVSQVQHLLSHFNKQLFQFKFPVEGQLGLQKKGGSLHLDFSPEQIRIDSHIFGVMSEGVLDSSRKELILQDISLNFEYDHLGNTLEMDDIEGNLLVGTPDHFEEYFISGDKISFTDYSKNESNFDLQLIDRSKKIARIKGRTYTELEGDDHSRIHLSLDHELSHFGNLHLSHFTMILKTWDEIDQLDAGCFFHLKPFFSDLGRFSSTGLPFLSRSILKEISELKDPHGYFKMNINYDGDQSLFSYEIEGNDVGIGTQQIATFLFTGNKRENVWSINTLQLDDISLAADILKDGDLWNIHFLGARIGQSLLIGLEGGYRVDEGHFTAKINLLDVDFSQMEKWPKFMQLIDEWQLNGHLNAYGTIDAVFDHSLKNSTFDLQMHGALNNGQILGMQIEDTNQFSFLYSSEHGLIIHDLQTAIKAPGDEEWQMGFYLHYGAYDFKKQELLIDNLRFLIPASNVKWWSDQLFRWSPATFTQETVDFLQQLKKDGNFEGGLRLTSAGSEVDLQVQLDDGVYWLQGKDYDLAQLMIHYNKALSISANYKYHNQIYQILLKTSLQDYRKGELTILEETLKKAAKKPLTVHWELTEGDGIYIHKVEGSCSGVSCDLAGSNHHSPSSDYLYLSGKIDIDMNLAGTLLEPALFAQILPWKLGDGYFLQGNWTIDKRGNLQGLDRLSFEGDFYGQNFVFYGYRFQHLFSTLQILPGRINLKNLACFDPCGTTQIESVACWKLKDDRWQISIPRFQLTEFRPSLLKAVDQSLNSASKTLVITSLDVYNFTGILGFSESFTGKGSLVFSNPPKRNFHSTILAIPAELLTRIGLDLAVLNPVRGTIDYQIKNSRVEFTAFKDVYSKNRLSKFYLSKGGSASYVDFDGNLHMQVRMKQYNLIFKLAELFTVSVQGTLSKPTYSLQKQPSRKS